MKAMNWRLAAAVCWLACTAWGADFAALKPQGYVNDFAGVIDSATLQQLNAYCAQVEKVTGAQMALVTLRSTEGEPIEDVANLLFRKWGVGKKETKEGVLVLLAVQDHRSRIEVGYGLEPIITDGYVGGLLRNERPSLRTGDYGQAMADVARNLGEKIAASKGVSIGVAAPRARTRPAPEGFPIGPAVIAGIVLVFFLFMRARPGSAYGGGMSGFLTGMIIGNLMGGGGPRTHGGGGFGGSDSGDSFGGFGGGDSGGGGASSDW